MSTNFTKVTNVICCVVYLYQSSRFKIRNVFIPIPFDVCFGGKLKCPEGVYIYIYIYIYRKNPYSSDTRKIAVVTLKFEKKWLYHRVMCPQEGDGMVNSVETTRTAPLRAF